jgi:hypothetical protein
MLTVGPAKLVGDEGRFDGAQVDIWIRYARPDRNAAINATACGIKSKCSDFRRRFTTIRKYHRVPWKFA